METTSDAADPPTAAGDTGETDPSLPPNRFELELEFVQCLASPAYLHHLATSGLLSDPSFLSFLSYLQYWRKPEYVRFITYPHALHFLDLLVKSDKFRREMSNVGFRNFVHEQQFYSWQFRSGRLYGRGLHGPQQGQGGDGEATSGDGQLGAGIAADGKAGQDGATSVAMKEGAK